MLQWLSGQIPPAVVKGCFCCYGVTTDPLNISRGSAGAKNVYRVCSHRNDSDEHVTNIIMKV